MIVTSNRDSSPISIDSTDTCRDYNVFLNLSTIITHASIVEHLYRPIR